MDYIRSVTRRTKNGLLFPVVILIVVLFQFSCESPIREGIGAEDKEVYITISLAMPTHHSPVGTRAMTKESEEEIQTIHVLVFEAGENGRYIYTAQPEGAIIVQENKKTFTIQLRKGEGYDLVILANSESILASAGSSVINTEKNKAAVLSGLMMNSAGKWYATDEVYTPFPMCSNPAELTNQTISDALHLSGINLYRMTARVNIALGSKDGVDATTTFDLKNVRVYNRNSEGWLKPVFDNESYVLNAKLSRVAHAQGEPLVYEKNEIAQDEIGIGVCCTNEIYLFEVDNTSPDLSFEERPCLVVGGSYNGGSMTYYRIDFSSDAITYFDIVRNHSYQIRINSVNGNGYATPDEAFGALPVNMDVAVVPWNDNNMLEVATDGQYELGVNRKEFSFFRSIVDGERENNRLIVTTTYDRDWSVSVMNGDEVATSGWLKIQKEGADAGYSVVSTGTAQQSFYLQAEANTGNADRTAYIHAVAGRITQVIKVTQSIKQQMQLSITNEDVEVDELTWMGVDDIGMKTIVATWTPENRACAISVGVMGGSGFEFATAPPFGATTVTGGAESYEIIPKTLTEETEGYPFIDRSSAVTFTLSNEGESLSGSVLLRQVNYALTVDGSQNPEDTEVLTGSGQFFTIKCNTSWVVSVVDTESSLESYTSDGYPNITNGTTFGYKFMAGKFHAVTFTFSPKVQGLFAPVSVTVTGVEKLLPVFALSNIVYDEDGERYTFATSEEELVDVPANVQGLLFKWGSLIGIGGNGTVGGGSNYDAGFIPFTPTDYKNGVSNFSTFDDIPYLEESTGVYDYSHDEFEEMYQNQGSIGYDAAAGKGDICRYISDKGWVEGRWRMPTAQELTDFYKSGSIVGSSWKYGLRVGYSITQTTSSPSGIDPIFSGWFFGKGVTSSTVDYTATGSTVFFPGSGYRESTGKLFSVAVSGYYSSCSPSGSSAIYAFNFGHNGGTGNDGLTNSHRIKANSVRCIRDN